MQRNDIDFLIQKEHQETQEYKDMVSAKDIEYNKYISEMESKGFDNQHDYEDYIFSSLITNIKLISISISVISLICIIYAN